MKILVSILTILLIWFSINLLPKKKRNTLHKFEKDRPLVIAHRGGRGLAPESTLAAFLNSYKLGVDVLEFDVHLTRDGHLVTIHDPTVDSLTNGSGNVNEMTLAEIQALDAGAKFQDIHGEFSYKGKGVYIPTVEEVFSTINNPDMLYIIEIKHTNHPTLYRSAVEKLWKTIQEFGLEENVILASFKQEIIDLIHEVSSNKALVSAGREEATRFVMLHKLWLAGLYRPKVDAIHIPIQEGKINLTDKKLIRGAENLGIQVHYWTINDQDTMKKLLHLGAHGIMTDRPDLLLKLIHS